jgi:poly(A) polymerase
LQDRSKQLLTAGLDEADAMQTAADEVLSAQLKHITLPRRFSLPMQEIWSLQSRLTITTGKRPLRLLAHPRFRAAYDFLLLRAEADPELASLAQWWTRFMEMDEVARKQVLEPAAKPKPKPRRRRSRRPRQQSSPEAG